MRAASRFMGQNKKGGGNLAKPTRIISVRKKDNNYGTRGAQRVWIIRCDDGQEYMSHELAELVGIPMRTLCQRLAKFEIYEEAIFYPHAEMKVWKSAKAKARREARRAEELASRDPKTMVNKGSLEWQQMPDTPRDANLYSMRKPTKYDRACWR
jgi:hypothetical protein